MVLLPRPHVRQRTSVTGMFANENAGNPNAWTYVADPSVQARNDGSTIVNPAGDLADQPEQQAQSVLGLRRRAATARRGSAPRRRPCRQNPNGWIDGGTATIAPEGRRLRQHDAATHLAGRRGRTRSQQDAVRVRLQRVQQPLGRHLRRRATRRATSSRSANRAARSRACATARSARCAAPASRRPRAGSRPTRGTRTCRT